MPAWTTGLSPMENTICPGTQRRNSAVVPRLPSVAGQRQLSGIAVMTFLAQYSNTVPALLLSFPL